MREFMLGALTMGWVIAGLFFLRFWRETRDSLFLIFATSFWILALTRYWLATLGDAEEDVYAPVYWMRFAAFALILFGILLKNSSAGRRKGGTFTSGG